MLLVIKGKKTVEAVQVILVRKVVWCDRRHEVMGTVAN